MAKKIYVIEDNEKNMSLFTAILNTIPDIEISSETRGDTGLELIKNGNPDLIILDIQLPGLNGIEICKELRQLDAFKDTPIIAVTAFTMKGDQENIMGSGFTEYVSKPIRVMQFKETVSKYLQ
ncbi:MAG TPA: response regulator [Candidatus Lokiarchaeia archaeon]|nr:response regulator [Candidatus Lokiarchaeia archaeon]